MEPKLYHYNKRFELENGAVLPRLDIAYHTFGTLSPKKDNVIWVCHALTANSDVADWWPHTVEKGKFLDPEKYFIVCANMLGSHYGTTGPLHINPSTGAKYYSTFPMITVRDVVRCNQLLAQYLGIKQVEMLIGSSVGGFQVLEWLISQPSFARKAALIATCAKTQPWAIAFNESQRMAIETDPTFGQQRDDAGMKGLATARSIALLSYRGQPAYDKTQQEKDEESKLTHFRASSYQRYQGEKLCKRFNAYTYYRYTQLIDSHDVSRGRNSIPKALGKIKARCSIVAITTDIIFPICEHEILYRHIPDSSLHIIHSDFGHDGFLIEHEQLDVIIKKLLEY